MGELVTARLVLILTTAGDTSSTKSVKSGKLWAMPRDCQPSKTVAAMTVIMRFSKNIFFSLYLE
jgi:hypothetical protein